MQSTLVYRLIKILICHEFLLFSHFNYYQSANFILKQKNIYRDSKAAWIEIDKRDTERLME